MSLYIVSTLKSGHVMLRRKFTTKKGARACYNRFVAQLIAMRPAGEGRSVWREVTYREVISGKRLWELKTRLIVSHARRVSSGQ